MRTAYRHTVLVLQHRSIDFNPPFAADLFFLSSFARLAQVREDRSTGSKQTLNGLFICIPLNNVERISNFFMLPPVSLPVLPDLSLKGIGPWWAGFAPALLYPGINRKFVDGYVKNLMICFNLNLISPNTPSLGGWGETHQALISTSTPEGRSSLDKASTVLEEDV